MTQKQLIDQFCEFRGKCTTDDVVALNFAYEMLAPHWISVEDELPKDSCYILVASRGIVHQWRYGVLESADVLKNMYGITHWMPLPVPPSCSDFPNNQERRVIGTADHIKTALDVMKEGGAE